MYGSARARTHTHTHIYIYVYIYICIYVKISKVAKGCVSGGERDTMCIYIYIHVSYILHLLTYGEGIHMKKKLEFKKRLSLYYHLAFAPTFTVLEMIKSSYIITLLVVVRSSKTLVNTCG